MNERVRYIAADQHFAQHPGIEVVSIAEDRSVVNEAGEDVAIATINYKLDPRGAP